MRETTRRLLLAAPVVGATGDWLLRGDDARLGFALWATLLVAVAAVLGGRALGERRWLLLGILAAAWGTVVRSAPHLQAIDLASFLCTGALAVWAGNGGALRELTVLGAIRAAVMAPVTAVLGAAGALADLASGTPSTDAAGATTAPRGRGAQRARALVLGVLLAGVPLLIVSGLLMSSDAVFAAFLDDIGGLLAREGVEHLIVIAALTWVTLGLTRAVLGAPPVIAPRLPAPPTVEFLTVSVALYGLVLLLALFLGTQARALFGGEAYLLATAGLTRAAYARQGFFQLALASGVVVGTLVVAESLLAADDAGGRRRYRAVGTVLVGQVAALLGSAAWRLSLYVQEFGLTADRALAAGVTCWVVALLVAFAATTLRGQAVRFAPAMLRVTVGWVLLMHAVNLEGLVVRTNAARAASGAPFDVAYHARLSPDALPSLRRLGSVLPADQCAALDTALRAHWAAADARRAARGLTPGDWRQWSIAGARLRRWLAARALPACAGAG